MLLDFNLQKKDNQWILYFPDRVIEFDEIYDSVKKILGKYKKVKGKSAFIFDYDPTPYVEMINKGESPNIRQENQFFETPKEVWEMIFDEVGGYLKQRTKILEPSAGRGSMFNAMKEWHIKNIGPRTFFSYQIHLIEAFEPNRYYLKQQQDWAHSLGIPMLLTPEYDFLELDTKNQYDLILANPPFNKGQAEAHFAKMLEHLREDGVVASILPESCKKSVLPILKDKYSVKVIDLKSGTFKHTGVKTFILLASKQPIKSYERIIPYFKLVENDKIIELDQYGKEIKVDLRANIEEFHCSNSAVKRLSGNQEVVEEIPQENKKEVWVQGSLF